MEDVLEQLVGDIWDESDEVEPELVQTGVDQWTVSGDMSIFSLFEELEIDDRDFDSDYNTVGGWATGMLGHIPEAGESFTYQNLEVTVTKVEEQRILTLRVKKLPAPPEEDEGRKKQD